MREIKLSQGRVAIVDDEDYDLLMQWNWFILKANCTDYAVRQEKTKTALKNKYRNVYMHRAVMKPTKDMFIDHINHNGLDNRKENLRIVTNRENLGNRKVGSKSGYTGVYPYKGRFQVIITINSKLTYIGTYDTAIEGHAARIKVLKELN